MSLGSFTSQTLIVHSLCLNGIYRRLNAKQQERRRERTNERQYMATSKLKEQQIVLAPVDKGPFQRTLTLGETPHCINPETVFLGSHSFTDFQLCPIHMPRYYDLLHIHL